MVRKVVFSILIIIAYLIQTAFGASISLGNIAPNLIIIIVCMYGLLRGRRSGMFLGFFAGLLLDIFYGYGDVIGINALLYMYIGYINGIFNDMIYFKNFRVPLVAVAISELSYQFIYYVITFVLRNKLNIVYYFENIILPELVYTVFVALFLYRIILFIDEKILDYEQRSETKVDQGDI